MFLRACAIHPSRTRAPRTHTHELDFFQSRPDVQNINQASLAQLNSLLDTLDRDELNKLGASAIKLTFFARKSPSSTQRESSDTIDELQSFQVTFNPNTRAFTRSRDAFKLSKSFACVGWILFVCKVFLSSRCETFFSTLLNAVGIGEQSSSSTSSTVTSSNTQQQPIAGAGEQSLKQEQL